VRFTHDGEKHDLIEPDQWTTLEAIQLQKHTGLHPVDLWEDLARMGPTGLHAAIWITLRRGGSEVAWEDLNIPHFGTVNSLSHEAVEQPPDPSSASTPPQ
jgi:hypothetical protein